MSKNFTASNEEEWALLRIALLRNHLREQKKILATETQAKHSLQTSHRQEMAQISRHLNPFEWAAAITRYMHQLNQLANDHQTRRYLLKSRQEREFSKLEKWIKAQTARPDETLVFRQLHTLFGWSLSRQQRHSYHQALHQGFTLVLTDPEKSILWTSRNFLVMTGYQLLHVVGRTPRFLQGPKTDPATIQYMREQLGQQQPVNLRVLNYRKTGEPYLCQLWIEPLRNRRGELTHFLAVEYEVADGDSLT